MGEAVEIVDEVIYLTVYVLHFTEQIVALAGGGVANRGELGLQAQHLFHFGDDGIMRLLVGGVSGVYVVDGKAVYEASLVRKIASSKPGAYSAQVPIQEATVEKTKDVLIVERLR